MKVIIIIQANVILMTNINNIISNDENMCVLMKLWWYY